MSESTPEPLPTEEVRNAEEGGREEFWSDIEGEADEAWHASLQMIPNDPARVQALDEAFNRLPPKMFSVARTGFGVVPIWRVSCAGMFVLRAYLEQNQLILECEDNNLARLAEDVVLSFVKAPMALKDLSAIKNSTASQMTLPDKPKVKANAKRPPKKPGRRSNPAYIEAFALLDNEASLQDAWLFFCTKTCTFQYDKTAKDNFKQAMRRRRRGSQRNIKAN